jgi:hypothetical protein
MSYPANKGEAKRIVGSNGRDLTVHVFGIPGVDERGGVPENAPYIVVVRFHKRHRLEKMLQAAVHLLDGYGYC